MITSFAMIAALLKRKSRRPNVDAVVSMRLRTDSVVARVELHCDRRRTELFCQRSGTIAIDIADRDTRSLLDEALAGGRSDAGCPTRHDGYFVR